MADIIPTKTCLGCKVKKPLSEFHKNRWYPDGYKYYCKNCIKAYQQSPHARKLAAAQNSSPNGRQRQARYRINNREKCRARAALHNAIIRHGMPRPQEFVCSCGKQAEQYHHASYARKDWLVVVALCKDCHIQLHQSKVLI